MDETLGVLVAFNILFASTIAFGVVYNAARISLSERSRELASLRVLGFTRARSRRSSSASWRSSRSSARPSAW